ncbi:MAG: hypothetical protein UT24_C0003G0065 [Candidatus Woesebacteria bacterium GW2011_GWB1_39_12]|uniref:Uncharacterized protein n=1 Tax=Candidatus Woesebacteria bacterium GW2011_GWB1_39_12 TaxID=1618574 RepID=A0A0G0MEQ3_9BACT|nr:MAG: hypothetical protein UT24_C0003G0065 [Candidatus Woesebacteria bacterium GW2011_GWB1_39_12]
MSSALDAYASETTSVFEGKVANVSYHKTAKGDVFALVSVSGVEKPLAIPVSQVTTRTKSGITTHKYPIPSYGNHVSASDVHEGELWIFLGHRSIVEIKPPDFHVWRNPSKVTESQEEAAEGIILGYLKEHDDKGCSPNDVRHEIQEIFPERDPHIVGVPFLRLSKKGLIHKYGQTPSDDNRHHGSPVSVWHLTKKGQELVASFHS